MRLPGKTAIVTGSSRGIGRAIAMAMAKEGAHVVVNGRNKDVEAVAQAIHSSGGKALAIIADVTKELDAQRLTDDTLRAFGSIDILVNNAGGGSPRNLIEDIQTEIWEQQILVNLTAAFLCSRAAIGQMKKQGSGRIINISSQGGRSSSEMNSVPYASAKAGLFGFTRQLAKEVGPYGILVNSVAPGVVLSGERMEKKWLARRDEERQEMLKAIPLGRLGKVEEIASVVVFLASEESSYISGAAIDVNGGRFMF